LKKNTKTILSFKSMQNKQICFFLGFQRNNDQRKRR
jgi:hypothetical protein